MRITGGEIINFGPHQRVKFRTDVPVIGLMGDNGSGKTNFKNALKFAFTGKAGGSDENLASFVYNGGDDGTPAKSAIVRVDFCKNGNTGSIMRKILRSGATSRELKWMGETKTKDAEVKSLLLDILSADEHVMDNAVFISQGELDKLLFGTPTEREEMFVKMMLLGYMSKVADTVEQRAQMLARTIQDQTTLKDEAISRSTEAENELVAVEEALRRCPDLSKEIAQWQDIIRKSESIQQHQAEAHEAADKIKRLIAARTTFIAELDTPDVHDLTSFDKVLQYRESELSTLKDELMNQRLGKEAKQRIGELETDLARHADTIKTLEGRGVDVDNEISEEPIRSRERQLVELEHIIKLKKRLVELHSEKVTNEEKVKSLTPRREEIIKEIEQKAEAERLLADQTRDLKVKYEALTPVVQTRSSGTHHCPLCEQEFLKSFEQLDEMCTSAKLKYAHNNKQLDALRKELGDLQEQLNWISSDLRTHMSVVADASEELENVKEELNKAPKYDESYEDRIERLNLEIHNIKILISTAKAEQEKLRTAKEELKITEARLAQVDEKSKQQAKAYNLMTLNRLESEHVELEKVVKDMRTSRDTLASIYSELKSAEELKKDQEQKETKIREALAEIEILPRTSNILSRFQSEEPTTTKDVLRSRVLYELKSRQDERLTLEGRVSQAKSLADSAAKRLREIEKREQDNAEKQLVLDELRRVKEAFSRKGIPRKYIQYYYSKLVDLAQQSLLAMEANFNITPHPTKPVSLQFMRTDKPGGAVFEQNKLSGGQSVRLSMAFLLAIQRLLVPDLGFLFLDEPSMHLDTTGVESLRDLIVSLGAQLDNTETQIWICDHNDILSTAFGKLIRL